jgi:microcompartment protein CcmK/EutM
MIIARVQAHIVATAKNPAYDGHKILRLLPETLAGSVNHDASPIVALDLVDSGIGDLVLVCQEGRWARETVGNLDAPVRSMIVGVIESFEFGAQPNSLPTS